MKHILHYKTLRLVVLIIPAFKGDSRETHQNDDNACRLSVSRVAGSVWIPAFRWNDDLGEYGNDGQGGAGMTVGFAKVSFKGMMSNNFRGALVRD